MNDRILDFEMFFGFLFNNMRSKEVEVIFEKNEIDSGITDMKY